MALEAVRSVSAGGGHTAAITRDGCVFTWGDNCSGQLGHSDETNGFIPKKVASISHVTVKQVTAGSYCTLVLDAGSSIWIPGELIGDEPMSTTFIHIEYAEPWVYASSKCRARPATLLL